MKAWRESSSLIIAAKNGLKYNQSYDYNLLFLRRHKDSSYPSAFVFPGGMIESADADLKWHNLFKHQGHNENSFKCLIPITKKRPHIFQSKENELPRELSLRISAIRETFEECGILLCQKSTKSVDISQKSHPFPISDDQLDFWQKKVYNDANEFYNMCEKLECHPNLWALHEWDNWLTPTYFPAASRYNTAFFFTCLPQIPTSRLDTKEMEELIWATPEHMLATFKRDMFPPQQYNILKIAKYKNVDELLKYALEKSKNGIQQNMPVRIILKDGIVQLLPGDSFYPEKVDVYEDVLMDRSDLTMEEFRNMSTKTHRLEVFDDPNKNTHVSKL